MSGLETVASVIAVLTVSYQIISSLRNAIGSLTTLSREFEALKCEIVIIQQCIEQLSRLITADDETFKVFLRFQFTDAITLCAHTCETLQQSLSKWLKDPSASCRLRARLWLHRKDIQTIRAEISSARETTIFTAVSVHLYIQVKTSTTARDRRNAYQTAQANLGDMSQAPTGTQAHNSRRSQPDSTINTCEDERDSRAVAVSALQTQKISSVPQHNGQHLQQQYPQHNYPAGSRQDNRRHDSQSHTPDPPISTSSQAYAQHAQQEMQRMFRATNADNTQEVHGNVTIEGTDDENLVIRASGTQTTYQYIQGNLTTGKKSRGNKTAVIYRNLN